MGLFQLRLDFFMFVFSRATKIIIFFSYVPYYHQVQYTIRHNLSSQIEFFEEHIPSFDSM